MVLDDRVGGGEAKSAAPLLGAEVGIKDPADVLLRDADAFVDNRDPQVIAGHDRQRAFGTAVGFDDVFGRDGDQSAMRHCFLRVHQNIGEHLNQLHFIGLHGPEIGRYIEIAADG